MSTTMSANQLSPPEVQHNIFSIVPRKHKKPKPVSRGVYEHSRLTRVHTLNLEDSSIKNIPRAGVLFYTFINGKLHICFGRDASTRELTDFGGGRRNNESPIKCAIREGNEESRYAFSEIRTEQVQGFFCLYSSHMLIIFIPVASPNEMDIRKITDENFNSKQFLNKRQVRARCFNEITELVWLEESEVDNLLFSQRPTHQMFAKVRRFIYSCTEFSQSITVMKNILLSVIRRPEEEQTLQQLFEGLSDPSPTGTRLGTEMSSPRIYHEMQEPYASRYLEEMAPPLKRLFKPVYTTA